MLFILVIVKIALEFALDLKLLIEENRVLFI
jgi:hypothetical protein